MGDSVIKLILLILLWAVLISAGQILFKKGVAPLGTPHLASLRSYLKFIGAVLRTPRIWLGFVCIGSGIATWLIALAHMELSVAFPINSLHYLTILIAARLFLGETWDGKKILGTFLVIGGIVLVSIS